MVGPLGMVYKSRRQCLELEVAHAVRSDNHSRPLLMEFVHDALQSLGRGIEVVAVELYGKTTAALVGRGKVPASSDAEIGTFGDDMHKALVLGSDVAENLRGRVGGMIVHDDDVILECGFLFKG